MNILIAVNEAYLEPAKTMLYSLACQQSEHLVVYLLQSSIRREKLDEMSAFVAGKCHGELQVVQIDKNMFADVPKTKWWTEETYYRLIAFELLPDAVERVLWLDADIVVKGNISAFYDQGFDGMCIAACAEDTKKNHQRLGLSDEHRYFNAGVILYDLAQIRRILSIERVFNCIQMHRDHLDALDQDVLNLLFEKQVKYCEAAVYNNETLGFNVLGREKLDELKSTAKIIHFIGSMKPWNAKGANWADGYWWKYEKGRGNTGAWLRYRVMNSPVKLWHYAREMYYLVLGQLKKRNRV